MNRMTTRVQLLATVIFAACGVASAAPVYRYADCTSCAARIPDSNGTTDGVTTAAITIPGYFCTGSTVQAHALQLTITHSNVGDLRVQLSNPTATSVNVINRPLASGNCAGDDIAATFLDAGTAVKCGALIPAMSGNVKTAGVMATFGNLLKPGVWLVDVRDQAAGGDGYLEDAQLRLTCGYTDGIFNDSFEMP